jgi:hypothetical protein
MAKKSKKRVARTTAKKVVFEKGNSNLTAQAGLIPVVKFLNKHKVINLIKNTLDHERGHTAVYDAADAILLTMVALIAGARSLCGVATVWADAVLCKIAGWLRIPDETTLGRIFKTFSQRHVNDMDNLVHSFRQTIWKHALRSGKNNIGAQPCLKVYVDSTVKTVYGKQEGAAKGYNPQRPGALSYHPILAFCAETKEILQGWLRSGDAYTSNGVVEFTKQLLAGLPSHTRIHFCGDSGFFVGELLDLLDEGKHGYLIKVKLKGLKGLLSSQEWEAIPGQPGWEQCVFSHQCTTWSTARLFVAVRREKPETVDKQGTLFEMRDFDYFCYVVSKKTAPWQAHKDYGKRATCETWIEEAKNQMGLAHLKSQDFWASSAMFLCAVLAYNTIRYMALLSGDKRLFSFEPGTIRTYLIRVAGKLTRTGKQFKLTVPSDILYSTQWDIWISIGET